MAWAGGGSIPSLRWINGKTPETNQQMHRRLSNYDHAASSSLPSPPVRKERLRLGKAGQDPKQKLHLPPSVSRTPSQACRSSRLASSRALTEPCRGSSIAGLDAAPARTASLPAMGCLSPGTESFAVKGCRRASPEGRGSTGVGPEGFQLRCRPQRLQGRLRSCQKREGPHVPAHKRIAAIFLHREQPRRSSTPSPRKSLHPVSELAPHSSYPTMTALIIDVVILLLLLSLRMPKASAPPCSNEGLPEDLALPDAGRKFHPGRSLHKRQHLRTSPSPPSASAWSRSPGRCGCAVCAVSALFSAPTPSVSPVSSTLPVPRRSIHAETT